MQKQEKKSGYSILLRPPAALATHYRIEALHTGKGSHRLPAVARRTVWTSASSTQLLMDASSLWIAIPASLVRASAMMERLISARESGTDGPKEHMSQLHLPPSTRISS